MADQDAGATVRNAAAPRQVKRAGRLEKERREKELADVRVVCDTEEGRRFIFRLMGHCKVFESVYGVDLAYQAGKQDVGHYLMAEVNDANDELLFRMMREAKTAKQREDAANDAINASSEAQE
ncbi:MAG TPA: hypothetical protein VN755_07150 [Steroidobacteraceae bacterium]|nr:hypothetical protein [Steroidobacteraceae bacterium]